MHQAVMVQEVLENLKLEPGEVILDATIGGGAHAKEILAKIVPGGRLIGIDQDIEAIELTSRELKDFGDSLILVNSNFRNLDKILKGLGIEKLSGVLFDLGVSSYQLENVSKGFGIKVDSILDMRMDRRMPFSAFDVINKMPERELSDVIFKFGEEPFARRIARAIHEARSTHPISTTKELASVIARSTRQTYKYRKIHPATKTFQAIRIYVNDELGALEEGLRKAIEHLDLGARVCVISFHSLEDRIAKNTFREFAKRNLLKLVNKKPLKPSGKELAENPRSRSAKLRVAERIGE